MHRFVCIRNVRWEIKYKRFQTQNEKSARQKTWSKINLKGLPRQSRIIVAIFHVPFVRQWSQLISFATSGQWEFIRIIASMKSSISKNSILPPNTKLGWIDETDSKSATLKTVLAILKARPTDSSNENTAIPTWKNGRWTFVNFAMRIFGTFSTRRFAKNYITVLNTEALNSQNLAFANFAMRIFCTLSTRRFAKNFITVRNNEALYYQNLAFATFLTMPIAPTTFHHFKLQIFDRWILDFLY